MKGKSGNSYGLGLEGDVSKV